MKKIFIPIAALLFALPTVTTAQKLVSEKTYEVDKKAKRGYLDEVTTNATDHTTTLSFVTKATGNKVKYQDYIFDKDYNYVKTVESEEQLYRNKKYKGDNYFVEGISVEVSMLGKMVLKKKRVEYNWNWFQGGYVKKIILLDKVKPKDESGNSYMVLKKFENDETGEVIALVTAVGKTAVAGQLFFMKIDKDLKIEIVDKNTFTNLKSLKATFLVPSEGTTSDDEESADEDISTSDICFIFAGFEDKKNKESELNYEMWRVSHEGKIKNKLEFQVKTGFWNIESAISDKGSLYFVGPANEESSSKPIDDIKWKFYQLAKITGDKIDYVTTTNMDEFEAKLKKPASQKK
ncbi:MAG: hypothetical protein IAF38_12055, partial [Bacteroidia bacterium]|nr:hypothetical protein [Bacteroidia bacterium]